MCVYMLHSYTVKTRVVACLDFLKIADYLLQHPHKSSLKTSH